MDNRLPEAAICIPTRGLLLTSSKINGVEKESFAVSKNHVGLGHRLIDIIRHKLSYDSNILPLKIFRKSFSIRDGEKLLHASRCYIYTTAGAISGILFISTERVGFCSDKPLKTYSTSGKLLKFRYKVSIPLKKLHGVEESMNLKRPSNKYVELVTVDDFSFWFSGFPNYKKTLECLHQRFGLDCLSD
ncbi:GEM-like protein 7 [Bidens hawaiensis]|uniref:GEM-like protein 7 n=1 Tax=Bidens hawaiensis TaxID=980011 RepID=UPI00404B48FA